MNDSVHIYGIWDVQSINVRRHRPTHSMYPCIVRIRCRWSVPEDAKLDKNRNHHFKLHSVTGRSETWVKSVSIVVLLLNFAFCACENSNHRPSTYTWITIYTEEKVPRVNALKSCEVSGGWSGNICTFKFPPIVAQCAAPLIRSRMYLKWLIPDLTATFETQLCMIKMMDSKPSCARLRCSYPLLPYRQKLDTDSYLWSAIVPPLTLADIYTV